MTYETIIIGAGPGGVAAAVYAARKQLSTLLITNEFGGQSIVSETIYNWIGTPEISGAELAESFRQHVSYYEGEFLKVMTGSWVTGVSKEGELFLVTTNKGEVLKTKTVLISTGSGRKKLTVPGADIYDNKGVVYCASCDGPLFSGQDVVVIGGGNAAFETASQLAQYCKSVTILHRSGTYRAEEITVEKILARPNVRGVVNANLTGIQGEAFVKSVTYTDESGTEQTLPAAGVFVEIGQIPHTEIVKDLVELDEFGRIVIDPWTQRTSVPGVWAAGDCSNIKYHQNNIAAGDGVKALEDIYSFLHA